MGLTPFFYSGGEGGIDSNRLRAILTPSGRTACVQNASAFCRTGLSSRTLYWKYKTGPQGPRFIFLAERAGFEPAVRYHRTLAFQASTLNHSATSPDTILRRCRCERLFANPYFGRHIDTR